MSHINVPLAGLSVMLGIPAGRRPTWETVMSIVGTATLCRQTGVPLHYGIIKNCAIVTKARDEVLHAFLESDASRLLWVDDDMIWEPKDFMRLLALSTIYDVIGATYTAKMDQPTFFIKVNDLSAVPMDDNGICEVDGMGLGFTMMTREAVEAIAATKPVMFDQMSKKRLASVFRTDIHEGSFRGEDMAFFADLKELGYPCHLDPTIQLKHAGEKLYSGDVRGALKTVQAVGAI